MTKHKKVYSFLQFFGIELLFRTVNDNDVGKREIIDKLNLIDFGHSIELNPAVIDGDVNNYVGRVLDSLIGKTSLNIFNRFFYGISDPDKKIRIYFRKLVQMEFESNVSLIHWLEQSKYHNYIILSMLDISRLGKEYWKFSRIRIYHIPIINRYKLFVIKKSIKKIIKFIFDYPRLKKKAERKQKTDRGLNLKMFRVMFFPNKSVFYGDLFLKNHFYSKDKSSSFHPKNMIHLEFNDTDIEKTKVRYKEYFGFEPFYMDLHSLIEMSKDQIYVNILNCIDKELIRSIIKSKISFVTVLRMAGLYHGYLYFYDSIKEFEHVKIALVGYDILFPIPLSLALESKGVKTIAIQERFVTPCLNNFSYILDTQLTASNYISSILKNKSEMYYVKNYLPTGLIRSDKLIKPNSKETKFKRKKIIVFDHHVENNYKVQISQPVLNWPNDLFFRKEIIKIANDFKEYDFIVRGKDIEWTNIAYFNDILDQWNNTPNITIDADYSEFYRSYKLCNDCELIIARHTSIADECIAKGYEVIIHDYGINYDSLISNYYPKITGINFCHSYNELKAHLSFFRKNGYITNQREKNNIIETLFDGLSDGNVQSRITQYLQKIDYQELR